MVNNPSRQQGNSDQHHFTHHVARVSENRRIIADEDIYSAERMKLVSQQTRVTPSFYENLVRHKLLKPLERSLSIENALTVEDLISDCRRHAEGNLVIRSMLDDMDNSGNIQQIFRSLELPKPLSFKLTILREEMPAEYQHSLCVAYIAVNMGMQLGLEIPQLVDLANAGLYHDIAILHLEQSIFARNHPISDEERKQIYAHPLIASLMLAEFPGYENASRAIAEHHERLDGSGYPKGLAGAQIDLLGQILAVAELASSLADHDSPYGYKTRLMTALRLNSEHYSLLLTNLLTKLQFPAQASTAPPLHLDREGFLKQLSYLWVVFNTWFKQEFPTDLAYKGLIDYVSTNIKRLQHAMNSSGLGLNAVNMSADEMQHLLEEPEEILAILAEAQYQLVNLSHEAKRRWPELTVNGQDENSVSKWFQSVEKLRRYSQAG